MRLRAFIGDKIHVSIYTQIYTFFPQFNKTVSQDLNFSLLGKVHKSVFISLRCIKGLFPLMLAVLVLARIELIFFTVTGMGLQFGFGLKAVLITQGCLRYC